MKGRLPRDFWRTTAGSSLFNGPVMRIAREDSGLAEEGRSDDGFASDVRFRKSSSDRPSRGSVPKYYRSMYIPATYEQRYPYPLIVWFHGSGGSEHDLLDVMPAISTQNYIGLAVRGPIATNNGSSRFGWNVSDETCARYEAIISTAVRQFRTEYHIHSERIFLAGFDDGAHMCLRLLLSRPEWFGGAALFGTRFTPMHGQLARFHDLRGKPMLVGTGSRDRVTPVVDAITLSRLLHSAGMDVTTRVYNAAHEVTPEMFQHVNTWLMDGIAAAIR